MSRTQSPDVRVQSIPASHQDPNAWQSGGVHVHALRFRPVRTALALPVGMMLSPSFRKRRLPRYLFRNSIPWLRHPLSTLQVVRYHTPCKTGFRLVVSHCREGVEPSGLPRKVSIRLHRISPFAGLSWRDGKSAPSAVMPSPARTGCRSPYECALPGANRKTSPGRKPRGG